ncbi:MAG: protein arginine kinase [Clostridiales bacterium]|jgi:protein arginine kinase|nr:protein arginine kinase [Clostridiales bacterium]
MNKWYDDPKMDDDVIISSRVRLARNIKKYPFKRRQTEESAKSVIGDVVESLKRGGDKFYAQFKFIDMTGEGNGEKLALINKHSISPEFAQTKGPKALLLDNSEKLSIMINEEDHLRMQAIYPGDNIDGAWDTVDKTDNLMEEYLDYAFDKDLGYLTSCPTNTGTGLRASYMIHIPLLEGTGEFRNIAATIGKFGMTVRGIYGEGTEPMGSIYQISNQVTIGKSEDEIISSLKSITARIIESEHVLREKVTKQFNADIADRVYRAYGILSHSRKISLKEAIRLLSDVRFGFVSGILDVKKPKQNIYSIMMNIQNGILLYNSPSQSEDEADIKRADYIRKSFAKKQPKEREPDERKIDG